jgi:hypothetical protein
MKSSTAIAELSIFKTRAIQLPRFAASFDHLVCALSEKPRHFEPERPGGLEVDHQFKLDRGLNGKLARLLAFEDTINIDYDGRP